MLLIRPGLRRSPQLLMALLLGVLSTGAVANGRAHFLLDLSPPPAPPEPQQRSALAAAAAEQVRLGCDPMAQASATRNPFADTVIGRASLRLAVSEDQHRGIIAAVLSQDADYAFAQSASLRTADDNGLRYLGWLIPAYVLAKAQPQGYSVRLTGMLSSMTPLTERLPFSSADLDYLAAIAAEARGDPAQARLHIDQALLKEPDFYNAIVLGLRLRLLAITTSLKRYRRCQSAFDALFVELLRLVGLTRCPLQASQSEVYLRRFLGDPARNPAFLAAQVYLGVIARKPEHAAAALARFDKLPAFACKAPVSDQLHALYRTGRAELARERGS